MKVETMETAIALFDKGVMIEQIVDTLGYGVETFVRSYARNKELALTLLKLRKWRLSEGISSHSVAQQLGISDGQYASIEIGRQQRGSNLEKVLEFAKDKEPATVPIVQEKELIGEWAKPMKPLESINDDGAMMLCMELVKVCCKNIKVCNRKLALLNKKRLLTVDERIRQRNLEIEKEHEIRFLCESSLVPPSIDGHELVKMLNLPTMKVRARI